ncbi:hypothetical protein E2C01_040590 [Portunus trituberculatus]|uniref:Uncharacterized protein n=1 Tax=Portunus trituberculatus TaxID=210409 RepID=A0A5B7FH32_PORTR|nr:hypothetical protein [Portunus trituberculatus]
MMIRRRLKYVAMVWSPRMQKHIRKLERIQRIATEMVLEINDLPYEDKLKEMELPTLKNRWERGDLIMIYKIVKTMIKIDRQDLVPLIEDQYRQTRGHSKKIRKSQFCPVSKIKKIWVRFGVKIGGRGRSR